MNPTNFICLKFANIFALLLIQEFNKFTYLEFNEFNYLEFNKFYSIIILTIQNAQITLLPQSMEKFIQQKDAGNLEFKNKNFQKSLDIFLSTSQQIQKIQTKQFLNQNTELGKLYVILLINAAFACINIKQKTFYEKAIQLTTKALAVDDKNIKAFFRRGVARKEMAELIQRANGSKEKGLIDLYTQAKQDFQKVNLLEKSNDLAMEKFKQTVKDIYRVMKAQGQQIDLGSKTDQEEFEPKSVKQKILKSHPYEGNKKSKGVDMQKIMQQYKVNEVSGMVQKKVYDAYLNGPLPQTKSGLQKAIREIQKSSQVFCQLIYRFDLQYLTKIQPTFDMLSQMIAIILRQGKDQAGRKALLALRSCKSFSLCWKSWLKRQKQQFTKKWTELGLDPGLLQ